MAGQYQKLVNKQYNSPIGLYSDRSVREILERQSQVLENGAIGIDFNNPMANKPANLQNSAVLRMLEEEENRKRSGQPGSLKRVAWPPPSDSEEYIEQEPVHSQGGPLFTSKSVSPSLQNNHASPQPQPPYQPQSAYQPQVEPHPQPTPVQQPPSPQIQQQPSVRPWQAQQPSKSPTITGSSNATTFQPILSPTSPLYSNPSAPLSPNISKSPVSFTSLAKPWTPPGQSAPHFKPVQPPSLRTVKSYETSEQQHYHYQSQGDVYQSAFGAQETAFQQYQTPVVETRRAPQESVNQNGGVEEAVCSRDNATTLQIHRDLPDAAIRESPKTEQSASIIQEEVPQSPLKNLPKVLPDFPKSSPLKIVPKPEQTVTPPTQSQPAPSSTAASKGSAQNQVPAPQRYVQPVKQVEPPPSTITLRPQAPVSQAPPPLVTSQPATATLRGGKNLRGDLKWPPEDVKERMAAEKQHLIELQKGPACKPRKQCKDYSSFFAKHALTHAYPGYKIPPGTQFYDHNPVM